MPNVHIFHTLEAGDIFVKTLGTEGFCLSSLHSDYPVNAIFVPGSRGYELALAVVEGARGEEEPKPGWFAAGFNSATDVLDVEAAFQTVDAVTWSKFLIFAGAEFDDPRYDGPETYPEFLAANKLPDFTDTPADAYLESLGETFLGG